MGAEFSRENLGEFWGNIFGEKFLGEIYWGRCFGEN